MAAGITLKNLVKVFGEVPAVNGIDLSIEPGELFFLLGPSGCGKTTLLRCIAGFNEPDSGQVLIGVKEATKVPPHERDMGMVFLGESLFLRKLVLGIPAQASGKNLTRPLMPSAPQPSCYACHRPPTAADDGAAQMTRRDVGWLCNFTPALTHIREIAQPYRFWGLLGFPPRSESYALWPHMMVAENVAFGLEMRKMAKPDIKHRVAEALDLVKMTDRANYKPGQLSGGQQQRVALARALVIKPGCLLLNEPLSNLDAKLRLELRSEIRRICKTSGLTAVYVTHDQTEALSIYGMRLTALIIYKSII